MRNDDYTDFEVSILRIAYKRRDYNTFVSLEIYIPIDPNYSSWSRLSRKFSSVYDKKSQSSIEIPFGFKVPHLHTQSFARFGIRMLVYTHIRARDESTKWSEVVTIPCVHTYIPMTNLLHIPAFALFITVILNKPFASLVSRLLMMQ